MERKKLTITHEDYLNSCMDFGSNTDCPLVIALHRQYPELNVKFVDTKYIEDDKHVIAKIDPEFGALSFNYIASIKDSKFETTLIML